MRTAESYAQECIERFGWFVVAFLSGPIPAPDSLPCRSPCSMMISRHGIISAEFIQFLGETDWAEMDAQLRAIAGLGSKIYPEGTRYYRCIAE